MNIYFLSLGCDKNLVDSERMLALLVGDGHQLVFDEKDADAIIVNTCSFIADATDESVQNILRLAEYKQERCQTLVVAGCMAQRYGDEIFGELPEVDAIICPGDYAAISRALSERGRVTATAESPEDGGERVLTTGHFAYLKIAEGCDNRCTYCTIPSIRGPYRSREMDSLVAEARLLAERGVKELILVAQDTALYGADLYGSPQLHKLLSMLSEIDGLCWLRIMYGYPEHLTDELIAEMARNPKVCHYLDMPVQHGCDSVLQRMGRRGGLAEIMSAVTRLRAAMPDIALRTSIIAGFPGETEDEFQELLRFIADVRFDRLGVFAYSREDGTPAAKLKNQVPKAIKERRKKQIMRLQQEISAEKCKAMVGRVLDVMVDGFLPADGVYCGRSYRDCYDVDGLIFFESGGDGRSGCERMSGDFVTLRITGGAEYDLRGVVV